MGTGWNDGEEEREAIHRALDGVDSDAEGQWYVQGRNDGREAERARLRPLLERCLEEVKAPGTQADRRGLLADLRRELGLEE